MNNNTRRQLAEINRIYASQDNLNSQEAIKAVEEFERQEREQREREERVQREREEREQRARDEREQRERDQREQREREEQREKERLRIERLRIDIPREHTSLVVETIELIEQLQDRRIHVRQLHDMLRYLRIKQDILKIPFFAHYHNLANYVGNSNMLKAWYFNYRDENIYLVKNYILPKDEILGKINIEFRPNTFYMKQLSSYKPGTNLKFFGRLEIINLKTKKIKILPEVNVYSHDGTFSFTDKILNLERDLEINTSNVEENYLYYLKFTPIPSTIELQKNDSLENYPIFKGFYWLKMIQNIADILGYELQNDYMPMKRELLQVLDSLKQSLPKKGGSYRHKQKKSITKKYKLRKLKKIKTKKYKINKN